MDKLAHKLQVLKISTNQLMRMPDSPGSQQPWDQENPVEIMANDATKSNEII